MSKPAIICVDDEPTVLESLKIELKQVVGDSCLIETAESGEEALELFEELQTDRYEVAIVLADQIMPGLRGDELLQQIHQISPQTLNIMITGHADVETLSNTLRTAHLYRHIAKPWQSDSLRSTILEAMQSYQQTRELQSQNVALQQTVETLEQSLTHLQQSEQQWQTQKQDSLDRVFLTFAVQQYQQYQAVQAQVESLEHLNQIKDQFLDSISHKLRSPISNIRLATQMLEVRFQQLGQQLGIDDSMLQCDRYFQILRDECQNETELINDLLALIRLNGDGEPLHLSPIDLKLWIRHIAEPFFDRMQERQQQLQLQIPDTLPSVTTDLSHLERTITELLTNAWRYTPVGQTITISAQVIQLTAFDEAEPVEPMRPLGATATASVAEPVVHSEIWISVTNAGVEIPAQEHEQIFNQFYRLPSSPQGGSGLGLAIVKKRVEKLRGAISVTSQNDETTFTVKLPLHLPTNTLE